MSDFAEYSGKKVLITIKVDGKVDAEEVEGVAQVANETGFLLKPKGQTKLQIINASDVIEVKYVEEKSKKLERKVLKVVTFGQARTHLVERHGWQLGLTTEMTEKKAFDVHAELNHEELDLGHIHSDKAQTERVEAVSSVE